MTTCATVEEIRAEITCQIDWYEAKGREMKTREYQLALAVVIGATKALSDLRDKLPLLAEIDRLNQQVLGYE